VTPGPAADVLGQAFAALQATGATHARLLAQALAGFSVRIELPAESFTPCIAGDALAVGPPAVDARVIVRTDLACVLALLDGRETLEAAVGTHALALWGAADDLLAAFEALSIFLHGLVRSPAGPDLLSRVRRLAAQGACDER